MTIEKKCEKLCSMLTYLSVDDFVSAQCARLSESFPANFTHERPRASVHGHVAGQVVVRVKHLRERK